MDNQTRGERPGQGGGDPPEDRRSERLENRNSVVTDGTEAREEHAATDGGRTPDPDERERLGTKTEWHVCKRESWSGDRSKEYGDHLVTEARGTEWVKRGEKKQPESGDRERRCEPRRVTEPGDSV